MRYRQCDALADYKKELAPLYLHLFDFDTLCQDLLDLARFERRIAQLACR